MSYTNPTLKMNKNEHHFIECFLSGSKIIIFKIMEVKITGEGNVNQEFFGLLYGASLKEIT